MQQEEINYSKRQLFTSIAVLAVSVLVIVTVAAITSIIWVPVFILSIPFLIILGLLVKFTPVMNKSNEL
jgi:hypothetical protein